ncbi:bacterioferritin [Halioglobus japonicus]|uniref:Bacterioferritin n=1 Tax=Halioglobus japonicus TaxID=930805 RepID=A0AAP8MDL1_9GAMM|nr:bacterioferritin [Halioglobus japonicus]AQA17638.1 bacterioferritin [Halioglobus japonicus]PLW85579.1 bacterioferritin [Halioglobus japonicus]GHD16375.1 bacterioferritin [Halioglobus japonicus]
MQGNDKVIVELNKLLSFELAAMDQYFIHSQMYDDWGLSKLYERISHEFDDEKSHAKALIERILFLEGTPDMVTREPINVGKDVPAMLQSDLDVEFGVGAALKTAIKLCEEVQDYETRTILEKLLEDTEVDHTWWLEKQLGLIEKVGLQNYLQSQME